MGEAAVAADDLVPNTARQLGRAVILCTAVSNAGVERIECDAGELKRVEIAVDVAPLDVVV